MLGAGHEVYRGGGGWSRLVWVWVREQSMLCEFDCHATFGPLDGPAERKAGAEGQKGRQLQQVTSQCGEEQVGTSCCSEPQQKRASSSCQMFFSATK
jgi:hypothetical protein